jgi:curved DNA-binding protein CbpA
MIVNLELCALHLGAGITVQEFEEDFYGILGVEETATPEEIRKAYLRLAKKLHPDRHPNDPEQRAIAQTQFAKVTRAHDIISDSERRAEYDTLRALARNRGQSAAAEANAVASNGEPPPQTDEATTDKNMTSSRIQQSQTMVDEDNINFKWASKHLLRADDLFKKKRYQEAETAMKEAIRLVPNEPKYHNKLAEIYLARGWKTLAMTEVQAALRIDPHDYAAKGLEAKVKAAVRLQSQSQQQTKSKSKGSFIQNLKRLFSGGK